MIDIFDTNWLSQIEIIILVIISSILGGLIGFERQHANKPAGIRTHAILAAAAALLVGLSTLLIEHFHSETVTHTLRADPIRVIEAIVTGVAFLGVGTIFRHRNKDIIEGLTTAASLLLVASIGIAVALKQLILAIIVTVFALAILRLTRFNVFHN